MNIIQLTAHAKERVRQRGMREGDVDVIVACGTLIGDETYVLRSNDVAREIERRKHEIARLERLRNRKVVVIDGTAVTCCRVHKRGWRELRDDARRRAS